MGDLPWIYRFGEGLHDKLSLMNFQVDFGNLAVGIATFLVAITTLSSVKAGRKAKVSEFRKEWIENLRKNLADFRSSCMKADFARAFGEKADQENDAAQSKIHWDDYKTHVEHVKYLESYILLMLNMKETLHQVMERKMDSMILDIIETDENKKKRSETDKDLPPFSELARSILKVEWDRVKSDM